MQEKYNVNPSYLLSGQEPMFLDESTSVKNAQVENEEKEELVRQILKEKLYINDREYDLFMSLMTDNKELGILFIKALNGDPMAKKFMKKMFDD